MKTNQSQAQKAAITKIEATRKIREGEKKIMSNGLVAEIVSYRKWNDIDVLFEDGYLASGKHYSCFKKGNITHPKYTKALAAKAKTEKAATERLGESIIAKCGLKMTITEYRSATDMDVSFENGEERKHVSWTHFKKGNILPPSMSNKASLRAGEEGQAKDGSKITIITYRSSTNIDVQFADGCILKSIPYSRFASGKLPHPKDNTKTGWKTLLGSTVRASCGLDMTFISGENAKDITILFEDGTIVEHKTIRFFRKGIIKHPILGAAQKENKSFFGFTDIKKAARLDDGRTFYYATSPNKERVTMTPQQMMEAGGKNCE